MSSTREHSERLYISAEGDDAKPGSERQSFATFSRAKHAVRSAKRAGAREIKVPLLAGSRFRLPTWLLPALLLIATVLPAEEAPRLRKPDWSRVHGVASAPQMTARSAILIEVESQTVLYALNPDLMIPPASLTKLVAIDVALRAAGRGEISLDTSFRPPEVSWAVNQAPGSSLMFLGPGQELTLRELLLGLSVSSGNDAGVALAEILDGSVAAFVRRMNERTRELGLYELSFDEPSGLSSRNTMTASSFARFLLAHIEAFPTALDELYSVARYTYPAERNRLFASSQTPITQANRNSLLGSGGVDGFKTGYIDESGYHIAVTAERDGRRLIALVLGIDADSHARGGAVRSAEAQALLEYGFTHFRLLEFGYPQPEPIRIYRGARAEVLPEGPRDLVVTLPVGAEQRMSGRIVQEQLLVAPFPSVVVGEVSIELDGVTLVLAPLVVAEQPEGSFFRRLFDGFLLALLRIRSWFGEFELPLGAEELVPA